MSETPTERIKREIERVSREHRVRIRISLVATTYKDAEIKLAKIRTILEDNKIYLDTSAIDIGY